MATQGQKNASDLGEQAVALAEQLGRIAGTIEGTAASWLHREQLADQLTRVRDGAIQMLESLTAEAERGRQAASTAVRQVRSRVKAKTAKPAPAAATRKADPSRAPGKRHRKPSPTLKGVKKSDERISKLRTAAANRQRRKSFA